MAAQIDLFIYNKCVNRMRINNLSNFTKYEKILISIMFDRSGTKFRRSSAQIMDRMQDIRSSENISPGSARRLICLFRKKLNAHGIDADSILKTENKEYFIPDECKINLFNLEDNDYFVE